MSRLQGIPEAEVAGKVDECIAADNTRIVCQKIGEDNWEIEASSEDDE
jgi:hypothetical protein